MRVASLATGSSERAGAVDIAPADDAADDDEVRRWETLVAADRDPVEDDRATCTERRGAEARVEVVVATR